MEVHFKGEQSEKKILPGGGPQGTILGMFLFLILINAAGFKEQIKNTGQIITQKGVNKRKPIEKIHMKFIDDMTIAESIFLNEKLMNNPQPVQPFRLHETTGQFLPKENCQTQTMLDEIVAYTHEHQMKINNDKTKAILFNNATKNDFHPTLTLDGGETQLELVEEIKLLGVRVRSDLSWKSNTDSMCQGAYSRLWLLRRLKPLGASVDELLDIYDKQIRCMVEYASPVWTANLTQAENHQIERVQKAAFAIIFGDSYNSYENALKYLRRTTLCSRRSGINLKFAKKCLKSEKYQNWFCEYSISDQASKTRSAKDDFLLMPVQARTKGFIKSPISYLTGLLNDEN